MWPVLLFIDLLIHFVNGNETLTLFYNSLVVTDFSRLSGAVDECETIVPWLGEGGKGIHRPRMSTIVYVRRGKLSVYFCTI